MAKKASKSYVWAWVKTNEPGKPTDAEKAKVTVLFDPYVQHLNNTLPPLKEPQRYNQAVRVFSKWYRSYFYLMSQYKCPPTPNYIKEGFEIGFARLTFKSPGIFDLAYFRHTGQWFVVFEDLPLAECFEQVKTNPIFDV